MENKQEPKISTGLAVHTNLVAGGDCWKPYNGGAVGKCLSEYKNRGASNESFLELKKCMDSC